MMAKCPKCNTNCVMPNSPACMLRQIEQLKKHIAELEAENAQACDEVQRILAEKIELQARIAPEGSEI